MPSSLNCPNCGAPAAADASTCSHCGSALSTAACPKCFGSMFVGMDFCPHCGARSARLVDDAAHRVVPCPGCKAEMRSVVVGTTAMSECPSCASNWVETATLTDLCASRQDRGSVAAILGAKPAAAALVERPIRYVPCPQCAKLMNRVNFGRRSGVVIDVCKGHGAWFEHGELCAALAFIERGGLHDAGADGMHHPEQPPLASQPKPGATAAGAPPSMFGFGLDMDSGDAGDDSLLRRALEHILF